MPEVAQTGESAGGEVTRLLLAWSNGDRTALERWATIVVSFRQACIDGGIRFLGKSLAGEKSEKVGQLRSRPALERHLVVRGRQGSLLIFSNP
ncbi:MAG: hypothetical protein ACRD9L_10120 [Bryobacteraceae bacterium]